VWREKILHNRGWRIHRIWSTRWWQYHADEIDRLQYALSEAAEVLSPKLDREEKENLKQPDPPKTTPSEAVRTHDSRSDNSELGISPQAESPPKCAHCGDPAVDTYKGEPICLDCYSELSLGVIPPATQITDGSMGHQTEFLQNNQILEEGTWDNIVSKLEDHPEDAP
jgi:hypothetical protein